MKIISVILFLSIVAFFVLFFGLGLASRSGKASGVIDGRLSECPDQPNCVCSEYKNNSLQYVEPIALSEDDMSGLIDYVTEVILDMGGSIQTTNEQYVACTFTSTFFRFVDDFEVRFDLSEKLLHVRSKSRVGYSDLGVNSKRVELFKRLYREKRSRID